MKIDRSEKKLEAISRMKTIGIIGDAVKQFRTGDTVMVSEPPLGGLYWLDDDQKKLVRKFEEKYDALVYLVVRSFSEFGMMDSFLYVSDHKEEWKDDNADLKCGYSMTYTINYDMPDCSEFGSIAFQPRFGGVVRIG